MVTLLPAAEGPIAMMADWIKDSFHVHHLRLQHALQQQQQHRQQQHRHTSSQPMLSAPITPDKEEPEEMLSFTTKRRGARVASPIPLSQSSSREDSKPPFSLPSDGNSAIASSSSSTPSSSALNSATPTKTKKDSSRLSPSEEDPKTRRLSEGKAAPFVEASALLQRRRDDVVFGLKEEGPSLSSVDEDLEGQQAAEKLEQYAS